MAKIAKLPSFEELCKLSKTVKSYPASKLQVINAAKELGMGNETLKLLDMFPESDKPQFESRADFYNRAANLAILVCEEANQPLEELRSLQS